jgi:hypothetical protein
MTPTLKQKIDFIALRISNQKCGGIEYGKKTIFESVQEGCAQFHDLLTAPITDVESRIKVEAHLMAQRFIKKVVVDKIKYTPAQLVNNFFEEGAHFYHCEILPSLLAKERDNAIRECVWAAAKSVVTTPAQDNHPRFTADQIDWLEREMIGENK